MNPEAFRFLPEQEGIDLWSNCTERGDRGKTAGIIRDFYVRAQSLNLGALHSYFSHETCQGPKGEVALLLNGKALLQSGVPGLDMAGVS